MNKRRVKYLEISNHSLMQCERDGGEYNEREKRGDEVRYPKH
jgi:hypothetical protein